MTSRAPRYWHGGAPGLKPGDLIEPRPHGDDAHLVDGCPTCEGRRNGEQLDTDDNDPGLVYITTDRDYARIYAAGYPRGALYRVEPVGELTDRARSHDPVPSWAVPQTRVLAVYDACVMMTRKDAQRLWRRYTRALA